MHQLVLLSAHHLKPKGNSDVTISNERSPSILHIKKIVDYNNEKFQQAALDHLEQTSSTGCIRKP